MFLFSIYLQPTVYVVANIRDCHPHYKLKIDLHGIGWQIRETAEVILIVQSDRH